MNNDTNDAPQNTDVMGDFDPIENLLSMSAQNELDGQSNEEANIKAIMEHGETPTDISDNNQSVEEPETEQVQGLSAEDIEKLDVLANERLKKMKDNTNKAYERRDTAVSELDTLKEALGLQEGQSADPDSLRRAASQEVIKENNDLRQQLDTLRQEQDTYKVNSSISGSMSGQSFVSDSAQKMVSDLMSSRMALVDGEVIDRETGRTASETLAVMKTNPEYKFLFKAQPSSGSSLNATGATSNNVSNKSITDQSFSEWLSTSDAKNAGKGQIF